MIVFELECREGAHRFEGWFGSSGDFEQQLQRGLVSCPQCGSCEVIKAPMAPRVTRKGNQLSPAGRDAPGRGETRAMASPALPPQMVEAFRKVAAAQAEALKSSRWVGNDFADDARAMHYGEKDHEAIHGQATADEVRALIDEGVEIAPVLFPIAPPGEVN